MSLLVAGIDEAGLGPILGPLCLGWSVFSVPDQQLDLWEALSDSIGREPAEDARKLVVADSKRVFSRNPRGRKRLESTVLCALGAVRDRGDVPTDPGLLFQGPLGPSAECLEAHPWYSALPERLPVWTDHGRLELVAERLRKTLRAARIELRDAGVRAVPAGELNRGFRRTENKSTTVGEHLLEVLGYIWRRSRGHDLLLVVDRQGGRAHYGPWLARGLPDARVVLVREEPGVSEYLLEREGGGGRVLFAERGEQRSLSVALASCLAKYARELSMEAFNAWFADRAPELRPTAGYATDGRRWLEEAGPALAGLDRSLLVRDR
jgi:ribonuclease HII